MSWRESYTAAKWVLTTATDEVSEQLCSGHHPKNPWRPHLLALHCRGSPTSPRGGDTTPIRPAATTHSPARPPSACMTVSITRKSWQRGVAQWMPPLACDEPGISRFSSPFSSSCFRPPRRNPIAPPVIAGTPVFRMLAAMAGVILGAARNARITHTARVASPEPSLNRRHPHHLRPR